MKKLTSVLLISIMLVLFGCTHNREIDSSQQDDLMLTKTSTHSSLNHDHSKQINRILSQYRELKTIKSLSTSDTILVAVEVNQFDRFQLPKIKKKVKSALEKDFSEWVIFVSTDQKIIIEMDTIQEQINDGSLSQEMINKKIKNLIKLGKEDT